MAGDVVQLRGGRMRRRVVVTFPLPVAAERRLSEVLGTGFELVDVKESSGSEDIVLLPSTSRQLVGKLRAAFPDAAVLVVEVEDAALGVGLAGQVLRTLDAGADGYFVARSVDELASIVDRAADRAQAAEARPQAALTSAGDDELSAVLDALHRQRQNTRAAPLDPDG
jgi:DNA-binding NarL/FixJ family response regulator